MRPKTKTLPRRTGKANEFEAGRHSDTTPHILSGRPLQSKSITASIPSGYKPAGRYADQQALVLHWLLMWTAATEERRLWGFYIEICSETWRAMVGSNYRRVRADLIGAGVIEVCTRDVDGRTIESYSTGTSTTDPFAKGFRLAERYRTGRSTLYEFTHATHRRKLQRHHVIDVDNLEPWDVWHLDNLRTLSVDVDALQDGDHWTILSASNLNNGFHFFEVCNYQRRHTLLTQLSRAARCGLRIGTSSDLTLCDVSACQPLLLGYLVGVGHSPNATFKNLPPLNRRKLPRDVAHWNELCEARGIYDHLAAAVKQSGDNLKVVRYSAKKKRHFVIDFESMTTAGFKRSSLIPLFDRVAEMEASPVFRAIVRDFPTVADYLRKIKAQAHAIAAALCQRLESRLIQHGAMQPLYHDHPDRFTGTIHDAFLTETGHAPTVTDILRGSFAEIGLRPTVKTEPARPP
jgi:hypothetical protein